MNRGFDLYNAMDREFWIIGACQSSVGLSREEHATHHVFAGWKGLDARRRERSESSRLHERGRLRFTGQSVLVDGERIFFGGGCLFVLRMRYFFETISVVLIVF